MVLILTTGIPTALAAHNPAYLYGFKLGKKAGLRGYYDIMDTITNPTMDTTTDTDITMDTEYITKA